MDQFSITVLIGRNPFCKENPQQQQQQQQQQQHRKLINNLKITVNGVTFTTTWACVTKNFFILNGYWKFRFYKTNIDIIGERVQDHYVPKQLPHGEY